jgi:intein/homing endonuclease
MRTLYADDPSRYLNTETGVTRIAYFNVALAAHLRERAAALLRDVAGLPRGAQREFLRAFFDDEGCMDFVPAKRRSVRGYQKDSAILELIQSVLRRFGIESRIVEPNEVVIIGREHLLRFEREINFSRGVCVNGNRTNSRWKKHLEKRKLLRMAIESYKR